MGGKRVRGMDNKHANVPTRPNHCMTDQDMMIVLETIGLGRKASC